MGLIGTIYENGTVTRIVHTPLSTGYEIRYKSGVASVPNIYGVRVSKQYGIATPLELGLSKTLENGRHDALELVRMSPNSDKAWYALSAYTNGRMFGDGLELKRILSVKVYGIRYNSKDLTLAVHYSIIWSTKRWHGVCLIDNLKTVGHYYFNGDQYTTNKQANAAFVQFSASGVDLTRVPMDNNVHKVGFGLD